MRTKSSISAYAIDFYYFMWMMKLLVFFVLKTVFQIFSEWLIMVVFGWCCEILAGKWHN